MYVDFELVRLQKRAADKTLQEGRWCLWSDADYSFMCVAPCLYMVNGMFKIHAVLVLLNLGKISFLGLSF